MLGSQENLGLPEKHLSSFSLFPEIRPPRVAPLPTIKVCCFKHRSHRVAFPEKPAPMPQAPRKREVISCPLP